VTLLEDCPLFNAAKGSVLTRNGTVEMDACLIDGSTRAAGAVACLRTIRNPILAARAVMGDEQTVLLTGEAADHFAAQSGCATEPADYFITDFWRDRWQATQGSTSTQLDHSAQSSSNKHGTVGAVAIDANGLLAAATSTGGLLNKMEGRISDSALPGAGTFADNHVAISFTGTGEHIMRLSSAARLAARVERTELLGSAAAIILDEIGAIGGSAGLIAVDKHGNITLSANTTHLLCGWTDETGIINTALATADSPT
jgi:beta-aspartyl-peptidase (threonine type)